MSTWEDLRTATLQKWFEVKRLLPDQDAEAVIRVVNKSCAFCDYADEMITEIGAEKRCDLCPHAIRYGSCTGMLHAVMQQISSNRWDRLEREVDEIIDHLEEIEEPEKA